MTWGVDDVKDDAAFWGSWSDVVNRSVLGENGNSLFALKIHRVHDTVINILVCAESARLPQHGIDQSGLSMVNVGDNRNIAKVITYSK